jgi:hypothetical protein
MLLAIYDKKLPMLECETSFVSVYLTFYVASVAEVCKSKWKIRIPSIWFDRLPSFTHV